MQAPIHVFNMFLDGVLEAAKGNRGLRLTQLLEVILDLVHKCCQWEQAKLLSSTLSSGKEKSALGFDYPAARIGKLFKIAQFPIFCVLSPLPGPRGYTPHGKVWSVEIMPVQLQEYGQKGVQGSHKRISYMHLRPGFPAPWAA
jgi:hypothetical protein